MFSCEDERPERFFDSCDSMRPMPWHTSQGPSASNPNARVSQVVLGEVDIFGISTRQDQRGEPPRMIVRELI